MLSLVSLAIIGLATWRISHFIADPMESGPFEIGHKLRHAIGLRYNELNQLEPTNELAKMFGCVWCSSVWVGAAWFALITILPQAVIVATPFALSAVAIILEERYG